MNRLFYGLFLGAVWLSGSTASAQAPAPAAPAAPMQPAPTTTPLPPPTSAPLPTPAPAATSGSSIYDSCVPACRAGFVCVVGQCVSGCNPACRDGEICTDDGTCLSACNPACPSGTRCTGAGQCIADVPPPAAAPAPPPTPAPYTPAPYGPLSASGDVGPRPDEEQKAGVRYHDGFYLRLGVGIGFLGGKATPSGSGTTGGEGASAGSDVELTTTGISIPVEVAIGGTPAPGLAIGAGTYAVHVPSANYSVGRGDFVREESADYGSISMIGPFIDIYPEPTAGFHVLAAPCFAAVAAGESDTIVTGSVSGVGFGLVGGIGYEGWVSDQWGVGLMGRIQYSSLELEDEDGATFDYTLLVPSVLLTTTLH